jgi:hypothetical protein
MDDVALLITLVSPHGHHWLQILETAQALNVSAVREPIELGGCLIPEGDSIIALVGAANRDPRVYVEQNRFLLDRRPNPHLSFARGLDHCL